MLASMFELIAAPFTPLKADGELNLAAVEPLAAHLKSNRVDGILVAGSTGEGPSLTSEERRKLAQQWVEVGQGLRVIIQVGHSSPAEAAALARHAQEIGADGVCAAPPSWFPINSADQLTVTCEQIAAGAPELPFLYYHIPALSAVSVPMLQFLDCARGRIPNFAGIKYTHLDPVDFQACMREHGEDVEMMWGCDEALIAGLGMGARAAVGSTYNFAAPIYRQLIAAYNSGDRKLATLCQTRAALLVETLASVGYSGAAKALMSQLGVDCGPVRAPLIAISDDARAKLPGMLRNIGFDDWMREAVA
ncbi:MAG: N-acetylneuraminate lyase [Planctomycetota bacterium]|jgi:N-acetylneuraminate lyase